MLMMACASSISKNVMTSALNRTLFSSSRMIGSHNYHVLTKNTALISSSSSSSLLKSGSAPSSSVGAWRGYQELCYDEPGKPSEKLTYRSKMNFIPDPPSDTSVDWVLVELLHAPSNPADLNVVEGKYPSPHKHVKNNKSNGSSWPLPNSASYLESSPFQSSSSNKGSQAAVGGAEGLGTVLDVRRNLTSSSSGSNKGLFQAGETVVLAESGWGTWRSHLWVPAHSLLRMPSEIMQKVDATNSAFLSTDEGNNNGLLSIQQVSLISQVAGTAYRLLEDFVDIQPGDVVIQNAGTSAVSMCAAELLRIRYPESHLVSFVRRREDDDKKKWSELVNLLTRNGTTNHTVVSEHTALEAADDKGAWRDWKTQHIPQGPAVLGLNSVHGPQTSKLFFPLLADDAKLITYGAMSMKALPLPAAPLIFKNVTACGYWHSRWMVSNRLPNNRDDDGVCPRQAMLDDLCDAVLNGAMSLPPVHAVNLSQASQGVQTIFDGLPATPLRAKLVWNLKEQ